MQVCETSAPGRDAGDDVRNRMNTNACRKFGPTHAAPRESRRFVQESLVAWSIGELADIAGLLTSELVTNVVRHAVSDVEVDVAWNRPTLRVEVRDRSCDSPALRGATGPDGGYGLRIVAALAQDWGVIEHADGKGVWFTMQH